MGDLKNCEVCDGALTGRQRRFDSAGCRAEATRSKWLDTVYNITIHDYDTILTYQGGGCGICGRKPKPGKRLAVDHAHDNGPAGPVRGLLCFFCNKRVLGARSAEVLVRTAEYVTNPPATAALGRVVVAPGRPKKKRRPRR